MSKLINETGVLENTWTFIDKDQAVEDALHAGEALLVPAAMWQENKDSFINTGKAIAVWLDSDESPAMVAQELDSLPLIALNFPAFTDGRAFSNAASLRQQYHYKGELRAIGNILIDQLCYLSRCGFDSYELDETVNIEAALNAFQDFKDSYQSTVINPEPLYRRRL